MGMTAMLLAAAAPARAQPVSPEPGDPAKAKPGLLKQIGIDQRLHQQVPLDLVFNDETGRDVRLGEFFGKRPVILVLGYYECPMLCTQVLNGLVSALGVLTFDAGREFDVVAVSINPKETPALAAQKKQSYMERYKRPHTVGGLALPDGHGRVHPPPRRGGRLPLRVRRGDPAVRARRRHRGAHAARGRLEIFLRDRVLGARYQVRPDGGVGGAHRHGRRQRPAALLPLRPDDREIRRDARSAPSASGRWRPCWRFCRSCTSASSASGRRNETRHCDG